MPAAASAVDNGVGRRKSSNGSGSARVFPIGRLESLRPSRLQSRAVRLLWATHLGDWCNGSTTDSGSVCPSSNLGSPVQGNTKARLTAGLRVSLERTQRLASRTHSHPAVSSPLPAPSERAKGKNSRELPRTAPLPARLRKLHAAHAAHPHGVAPVARLEPCDEIHRLDGQHIGAALVKQ